MKSGANIQLVPNLDLGRSLLKYTSKLEQIAMLTSKNQYEETINNSNELIQAIESEMGMLQGQALLKHYTLLEDYLKINKKIIMYGLMQFFKIYLAKKKLSISCITSS